MMRVAPLPILWMGIGIAACQGEREPPLAVADGSGVRITLGTESLRRFAVVDPSPLVTIGGPDASGPEQFFQIARVETDPRGRIWVADGQSGELRIFRPDGTHWKTRGGRGEGPGEFQRIRVLGAFRGDSVAMGDRVGSRVTVLDLDGELVRTVTLATDDQPQLLAHRTFPDGSVLAQVPRVLQASSLEPGRILHDTTRLVRARPGGPATPLAQAPGPLWLWTGRSQVPIPFTVNPGFDLDGEALHLTWGPAFRVYVLEGARLVEIYGVDRPSQEVRESHVADYRATIAAYVAEPRRPDHLAALQHEARPTTLPAYVRLVVDDRRDVWAQWYAPDTTWDVFGPDRRYLGRVEAPDGFLIDDIADGKLFGVWRDAVGVEHVRVYRLRSE